MRWLVASILCCGAAAQISAPRIGLSRFPDGTVRPVDGVPGAYIARQPVLRGALSFGSSGAIAVAKLPSSVVVMDSAGEALFETSAPDGPAVVGFSADGAQAVVAGASGDWSMRCDAEGCGRVATSVFEPVRAAAIGRGGVLLFATAGEILAFRPDRPRPLRRTRVDDAPALLRADGTAIGGVDVDGAEWIGPDLANLRSGGTHAAWNVRTQAVSPLNADSGFAYYLWRSGVPDKTLATTDTVDLGSFNVGTRNEFRIGIKNTTNGPLTLGYLPTPVQSPGHAFTWNEPSVTDIAAGETRLIFIWFAPTAAGDYTITVKVNEATFAFKATALPVPVWTAAVDGAGGTLGPGSTIDFGRIMIGSSVTHRILLSNSSVGTATVKSLSTPSLPFRTSGLALPLSVPVGATETLDVVFEPSQSGTFSSTLTIDNLALKLTGSAYDPPMPKPAVDAGSAAWASASQHTVSVKFAGAAQTRGNGTLALEFLPASTSATDDDAVRFTTGGARVQSFQFEKGDAQAMFGTAQDVAVQTGTTAGTLVFTATVGSYVERFSYRVDPAAVVLDSVVAAKSTGTITVTVTGYDNSRTAGSLAFTFYDTAGRALGSSLTADLVSDFKKFFAASPKGGGSFVVRAAFPVSGDISQVGAVDVRMANAIDSAAVERVPIR